MRWPYYVWKQQQYERFLFLKLKTLEIRKLTFLTQWSTEWDKMMNNFDFTSKQCFSIAFQNCFLFVRLYSIIYQITVIHCKCVMQKAFIQSVQVPRVLHLEHNLFEHKHANHQIVQCLMISRQCHNAHSIFSKIRTPARFCGANKF